MKMWLSKPNALITVLFMGLSFESVYATDYSTCLSRLQSYCNSTNPPIIEGSCTQTVIDGLLDNHGNRPSSLNDATAIGYTLCVSQCGTSPQPFSWQLFSQQFSAWLLPYLALISQLPFGAKHRADNVMSVFLTVGSPVLAGYSLVMTALNSQWIARKFDTVDYPNARIAVQILTNLQHAPLRILSQDHLLSSLIVLPENEEWWSELARLLDQTRTWSISAATSILWVIIAYIFTVIDSRISDGGQSVGNLWLWLLFIVIGWLVLSPKCDHSRLINAVDRTNAMAFVASQNRAIKASSLNRRRAISIDAQTLLFGDEHRNPPIFSYARAICWSQSAEEVFEAFYMASENAGMHNPVDANLEWRDEANGVHEANRRGSAEAVDRYCGILRQDKIRSRWASGVFARMCVASLVSLLLQWGTTGAAVINAFYMPTTGFGCRSFAYILYGCVSTLVWIMLVISSVLSHYASHGPSHLSSRVANFLSGGFCRLGKIMAVLNTIGIIAVCIFIFSNIFETCYCDANVINHGTSRFVTVYLQSSDMAIITKAWIVALVLALSCAIGFISFVHLVVNSLS